MTCRWAANAIECCMFLGAGDENVALATSAMMTYHICRMSDG